METDDPDELTLWQQDAPVLRYELENAAQIEAALTTYALDAALALKER
jgi:hypothetical protein